MIKRITGMAIGMLLAAATSAQAAPMDFEIDFAGSSVSITDQSGGFFCNLTNCGIDAQLNSGLSGLAFSLDEGESNTFGFIDWEFEGLGVGNYEVEATLAFSDPIGQSVSGGGGGGFLTLFGVLNAANLSWVGVPTTLLLVDGGAFSVNFQGSSGSFFGDLTTSATVSVDRVAAVPIPASLSLMFIALGGLAFVGRRRRLAAA